MAVTGDSHQWPGKGESRMAGVGRLSASSYRQASMLPASLTSLCQPATRGEGSRRGPSVSGWPGPLPMPTPGPPCPQCRCRPGFRLKDDGRTCADVDECSTTFPCSQRCINTHGSYKCLCVEGYAPRGGDPHSCKAVTGETGAWGVQLAQAAGGSGGRTGMAELKAG